MSVPQKTPLDGSAGVRAPLNAPVVGSRHPVCVVCGAPLGNREGQRCCSGKCRAALARSRKAEAHQVRDREIVAMLDHAETLYHRAAELLQQARQRLEKGT